MKKLEHRKEETTKVMIQNKDYGRIWNPNFVAKI